jgi:pimeloyl-ACP methyl ester carboxylesterase
MSKQMVGASMTGAVAGDTTSLSLNGVELELSDRGKGPALLFLHAGHPTGRLAPSAPVLRHLSENFRVIAPTHPGFGHTPAPEQLNSVDDLAYLYLDLLDALNLKDVTLAGVSFGGWIAAEMAVKSTERLARLVLANPVGIKLGDRETRDFVDIYSIFDKQVAELAYADPKLGTPDKTALSEDEFLFMAHARESTARYAWSPYLHNPKLKGRLHRIKIPTLVLWGAADRITRAGYGRGYAEAIPNARYAEIPGAGHFPHLEKPELLARHITAFAQGKTPELVS